MVIEKSLFRASDLEPSDQQWIVVLGTDTLKSGDVVILREVALCNYLVRCKDLTIHSVYNAMGDPAVLKELKPATAPEEWPQVIWLGRNPLKPHGRRFRMVYRGPARPHRRDDVRFAAEQVTGEDSMKHETWEPPTSRGAEQEAIWALVEGFGLVLLADPAKLVPGHPIHCELNQAVIHGRQAKGCDCDGPPDPANPGSVFVTIIVNGRKIRLPARVKELSYDQIARYAFPDHKDGSVVTITYQIQRVCAATPGFKTRGYGGSVTPGLVAFIEDGVVFNVADTSSA